MTIMNEKADIAQGAFSGCGRGVTLRAEVGSSAERHAAENAIRFERVYPIYKARYDRCQEGKG